MEKIPEQLVHLDDLVRCFTVLLDTSAEREFLKCLKTQELNRVKHEENINECKRLKSAMDAANKNAAILESKLSTARKLMDDEKENKKRAELERKALAEQLQEVRRILLNDPRYNKLPNETRERLSFLNEAICMSSRSSCKNLTDRLMTVADESDCTESLLSESSYSHSEDNLDDSVGYFNRKKTRRLSSLAFADENTDTIKRNKKSGKLESFTPTAPRVESLESLNMQEVPFGLKNRPGDVENKLRTPIIQRINSQAHSFVAYNSIMRQSCMYCTKKSGIGRSMWKCKGCSAIAHAECVEKVPLPCIPMGTPRKGIMNTISTYAPTIPPMIPAIVVHCVNEIENRGLTEVGLYKISGSEAGVQCLKEKFLKGRGAPNLSEESIYDICSYLKNFLQTLHEPLIARSEWNTFARAVVDPEKKNRLYHAISLLPQPNRDTLAYLILHLQRVANSQCKVNLDSLAEVFASVIVGYSENEQTSALNDAKTAKVIMEELLSLPLDYWCSLISFETNNYKTPCGIRSTPSTESLIKKSQNLFTPGGRRRFFNTPPHK